MSSPQYPGEPERNEALAHGSLRMWRVNKRYELEGDHLIMLHPFARPEVVNKLAEVGEGNREAALGFVREWGFLGRHKPPPDYHERGKLQGDSLDFIWKHSTQVKLVVRLLALLRRGPKSLTRLTPDQLRDLMIRTHSGTRPGEWIGGDVYQYIDSARAIHLSPHFDYAFLSQTDRGDLDAAIEPHQGYHQALSAFLLARNLVRNVINANTESLRPVLIEENDGGRNLTRTFHFDSLITVIYGHLADMAVGQRRYVVCEGCGKFFEQTHGRQKFCPSPTGGGESLCAQQARQRRHRVRKVQKSASRSEGKEDDDEGSRDQTREE